jgi:hypothetical protein
MRAPFDFISKFKLYGVCWVLAATLVLGVASPSYAVDTTRLSQICKREDESAIGFCFGYLLASLKVAVRNCEIRKEGSKQFVAKELAVAEVGGLNVVDVRSYFLDYANNTPLKDLTKDPEHAIQIALSRHFPCPQ